MNRAKIIKDIKSTIVKIKKEQNQTDRKHELIALRGALDVFEESLEVIQDKEINLKMYRIFVSGSSESVISKKAIKAHYTYSLAKAEANKELLNILDKKRN